MRAYALTHLSDSALLQELFEFAGQERSSTSGFLERIAEVDARKLYLPEGYASMHAYCVERLHLSEDAAYKRIQAARAARRFPALFATIADGRLSLTAVCRLAPHLTPENADELMAAATHRRIAWVDEMLARRFPAMEAVLEPRSIRALRAPTEPQLVSKPVETLDEIAGGTCATVNGSWISTHVTAALNADSETPFDPSPACPERFAFTIGRSAHDKFRYAQALLSHSVPSGDADQVFERALDALIHREEKRRFGAGTRRRTPAKAPRQKKPSTQSIPSRPSTGARPARRHVPARVRHSVWKRDAGRCTFVGTGGHRCGERRFLQFDHVDPVARGGEATVEGMRLRCRAHNQYEAERAFGVEFMEAKRAAARRATAQA